MNEQGTACGGCGFWTCECNGHLIPIIGGHLRRDDKNNWFIEAIKVKKSHTGRTPTNTEPLDNQPGYRVKYPSICTECNNRIEIDSLAHRNPNGGWRHNTCKPKL